MQKHNYDAPVAASDLNNNLARDASNMIKESQQNNSEAPVMAEPVNQNPEPVAPIEPTPIDHKALEQTMALHNSEAKIYCSPLIL